MKFKARVRAPRSGVEGIRCVLKGEEAQRADQDAHERLIAQNLPVQARKMNAMCKGGARSPMPAAVPTLSPPTGCRSSSRPQSL